MHFCFFLALLKKISPLDAGWFQTKKTRFGVESNLDFLAYTGDADIQEESETEGENTTNEFRDQVG